MARTSLRDGKREAVLLLVLFAVAVVFRLWFITLVPQPFAMDQQEYERYATKIYTSSTLTAAHSFRTYPWPLLMALVYRLVGFGNHQALYVVNALLDAFVALIVFGILWWGFKNKPAAWSALVLYTFNPFTSGYVGVALSEVLSGFFIASTIALGILFVRQPSLPRGFLLGLCAGMAAETRNAAFIWAIIPIALTLLFVSWRRRWFSYVAIGIGFTLTLLYPLYNSWRAYGEINATTVDSFYAKEFFQGALLKRLPPFTYIYPPESEIMWYEYYTEYHPDRTGEERRAMAQKYYAKGWEIIKRDPWDYIKTRLDKMWYVWQKENLFFYVEPGFERHWYYTYALNLAFLLLAGVGLLSGLSLARSKEGKWTWMAIAGSLGYSTLAFSLSHAEYRLSIPFYSLIIVLAALGVVFLWQYIRKAICWR